MRNKVSTLLAVLLLVVVIGCGGDGPTPPTVPLPTMADSIDAYDDATGDMQTAFADLNTLWDRIEAEFAAKTLNESTISSLVNSYVAQTEVVAAKMDRLILFEDVIAPYGGYEKGMFTDTAGAVAKGLFNVVKKTVVSSGQMLRTGWRVLSGSHTLKQALSASDSGIPIVSDAAKRLEEHNAARDEAIINAIESGDSQEGYVPLGDLQGSTTQEKIDYYRNLPDDDPLKKQTRGDVHLWNDEEKAATVKTLKNFTKDQVKNYVGAISGSDELVEIGDQMLSPDQPTDQKGALRATTRDFESALGVTEHKTILIQKKNQIVDEPAVAILDGVDADTQMQLASGVYDLVVIAEGYVRTVQENVQIATGQVTTILNEMYEIASHSLVLEGLAASPSPVSVGQPVVVHATVASLIGASLQLEWTISGGAFSGKAQSGANLTFTPTQVGPYAVSLTVTDQVGNTRTAALDLDVTGAKVQVTGWSVTSEQFDDGEINPGEQVGVAVTLTNFGTEPVTGTPSLVGQDGVEATLSVGSITIPAGGEYVEYGLLRLPVDFGAATGAATHMFSVDGVVLCQDLEFDVAFGVAIDPISSPVTDRVLTITGRVSNPLLPTAYLVIGGDIDQVYTMNLSNGEFSQDIAVEASSAQITNTVLVAADAGSRHAEASTSFTSRVPLAGLRVTLTWDTGGTDVDLWVTDPSGASCGYSNPYTASGLTLDFDDTDGYGPENITTSTAQVGTYGVRVHYYSDHDDDVAIGTACTVVVRLNEGTSAERITTYHGFLGDTDDEWSAATVTILPTGKAELIEGPKSLTRVDSSSLPKK